VTNVEPRVGLNRGQSEVGLETFFSSACGSLGWQTDLEQISPLKKIPTAKEGDEVPNGNNNKSHFREIPGFLRLD
jgi:hypothetical protein